MVMTLRQDDDVSMPWVNLKSAHQLANKLGRALKELHKYFTAVSEETCDVITPVIPLRSFQNAIQSGALNR
jgi:hypothetical protein